MCDASSSTPDPPAYPLVQDERMGKSRQEERRLASIWQREVEPAPAIYGHHFIGGAAANPRWREPLPTIEHNGLAVWTKTPF